MIRLTSNLKETICIQTSYPTGKDFSGKADIWYKQQQKQEMSYPRVLESRTPYSLPSADTPKATKYGDNSPHNGVQSQGRGRRRGAQLSRPGQGNPTLRQMVTSARNPLDAAPGSGPSLEPSGSSVGCALGEVAKRRQEAPELQCTRMR